MELPNLDQVVIQALEFFQKTPPNPFDISSYSLPFVVGSVNALSTGKVIFSQQAAVFADESNFKPLIKSYQEVIKNGLITQCVIISASGEKDSVWETELAKSSGLETTLLTCKPQSTAAKIADRVIAYKSIAEPYTYNTSTYLGMILSSTKENPSQIIQLIDSINMPNNFTNYQSYAFILPDKYINIAPMVEVKGDELFGPHLMIRAVTQGHARHAQFVHPWEEEIVISIGSENSYFGHPDHRMDIPFPKWGDFGTMMALTYYLCGQIQSAKHPYFKQNIEAFCADYGPKPYGKNQKFEVIVPAND